VELLVVTAISIVKDHLHLVHSHLDPEWGRDVELDVMCVDVMVATVITILISHAVHHLSVRIRHHLLLISHRETRFGVRWRAAGQPGSVTRSPAVPLVDRLTAGRPSAGSKPTGSGPLTETAAPTVTIKLPESYKDIADAVICSVEVSSGTREIGTFGPNKATLRGPALLSIQIAGIKVPHFFYFIDADAPPLVGYDFMQLGRLVIDVPTVWFGRVGTIGHVVTGL